ncbi:hypothetical protein JHD50_09690 [Sulfurimonas sp. MAG313]|nr:hypothetical protein [Sulfurimonas sp. MAG313]MDF1881570.1 hypothetical protein [Sulfurimonas sp. MAG313]
MRFFLLFLVSFTLAYADLQSLLSPTGFAKIDENQTFQEAQEAHEEISEEDLFQNIEEKPDIEAKLLYQSYFNPPEKLFKGQIFTITIKALSAQKDYESMNYSFSKARGIKRLNKDKEHHIQEPYFYDTFYFQVIGSSVRTPDVKTSLVFSDLTDTRYETLFGKSIQTVRLNPEKDFSKVLADKLNILDYKTSQYDNQHNIVVFSAEATMANLNDFSLHIANKEGIDSYEENMPYSNFTYYAVVSKQLNELKFSYFNLKTRHFKDVVIPIIVSNDRVSTQTDLAPTQNTHAFKKMLLAGAVSIFGLLLFILRRNKFYLIIFILPLFFIAKLAVPIKHVCIKEDSNIYLLPMKGGTIFERVPFRFSTEELGSVEGFKKIRMQNKQIGWVKNENICKY